MASDAPIAGKCAAKIRRSNPPKYCTRGPMPGRTRCKFHGGASPRGVEHYNWRGLGLSKDLPTRLKDAFERSLTSPDQASMATELALVDARVQELLQKLPSGDALEIWEAAQHGVRDLRKYLDDDKVPEALTEAEKLEDFFKTAIGERYIWREIHEVVEQRRRIADTEVKREKVLSDNMTMAQAGVFIGAVMSSIMRHVTEPSMRVAVANDLRQLIIRDNTMTHRLVGDGDYTDAEVTDDGAAEPE